jgi:hypothetical protein
MNLNQSKAALIQMIFDAFLENTLKIIIFYRLRVLEEILGDTDRIPVVLNH